MHEVEKNNHIYIFLIQLLQTRRLSLLPPHIQKSTNGLRSEQADGVSRSLLRDIDAQMIVVSLG